MPALLDSSPSAAFSAPQCLSSLGDCGWYDCGISVFRTVRQKAQKGAKKLLRDGSALQCRGRLWTQLLSIVNGQLKKLVVCHLL